VISPSASIRKTASSMTNTSTAGQPGAATVVEVSAGTVVGGSTPSGGVKVTPLVVGASVAG
jgi:hypothetical protein